MIIHPEYGPQFDPKDGTIGETQLVKRLVIVRPDGSSWYPRRGRYTWEDTPEERKAMRERMDNIQRVNPQPTCQGLRMERWWCYPGHHDPAYPTSYGKPPRRGRNLRERALAWLCRNNGTILSYSGYPGESVRKMLFGLVKTGHGVAYLRDGKGPLRTGWVQMLPEKGYALVQARPSPEMGRPADVVDASNLVWCESAPDDL